MQGAVVYEWLNKHFPNSVSKVSYEVNDSGRHYKVIFRNGHTLEAFATDIGTDSFLATCAMVYDL